MKVGWDDNVVIRGLGEYSQSPGIKSCHISKDSDRMNIKPLSSLLQSTWGNTICLLLSILCILCICICFHRGHIYIEYNQGCRQDECQTTFVSPTRIHTEEILFSFRKPLKPFKDVKEKQKIDDVQCKSIFKRG